MEHDLIDEYRLFIHPVVLGRGNRLFADGTTPTALELIDTKTTSRGVVVHVYQSSGSPEYGSALLKQEGDVVKGVTSSRTPQAGRPNEAGPVLAPELTQRHDTAR